MTAVFASARHKQKFLHDLRAYLAARALVPDTTYEAPALKLDPKLSCLINWLRCTLNFYDVLPIKADLTHVLDRWFLWLLEDELRTYRTSAPVTALYRRRLAGDEPTTKEWRSAATRAAYTAADANASNAARAAANAAEAAARAATRTVNTAYADNAAAHAAAASSWIIATNAANAHKECVKRMREALIKIVKQIPRRGIVSSTS